jgi:hypothetical protein
MVWAWADGAGCKGTQASINEAGFLLGQLTSAVAAEYTIVILVHTFTPSCGTKLSKAMNSAGNEVPGLKRWRRKGATIVQQWGPHSPMEASPSLLGQVVLGMVQRVVVLIPAPTRSISSALNERAPLRINTLFWSFIFSPFCHLGPLWWIRTRSRALSGRSEGTAR